MISLKKDQSVDFKSPSVPRYITETKCAASKLASEIAVTQKKVAAKSNRYKIFVVNKGRRTKKETCSSEVAATK